MAGASALGDDFVKPTPNNSPRTVVILGRTGNGKSATGNSILGRKVFKSTLSSSSVTESSDMQSTQLSDGSLLNVIDTPGLFDFSEGRSECLGKEIAKCVDMTKEGIHAFLLVFSVRTRFSQEEGALLKSLRSILGSNVVNYMIVVFTGGDNLEDMDKTLDEYLGKSCPEPLKEIIGHCENRVVLFNNKTDSAVKKAAQFQQLNTLVNVVIAQNNGKPYSEELFDELRNTANELRKAELKAQLQGTYEEKLKGFESKISETSKVLEKKISEEKAARARADKMALEAEKKSKEAVSKMHKDVENAKKKLERKLSKEKAAREKAEKMALEAKAGADVAASNLRREQQNAAAAANRGGCIIL